MAKDLGAEDSGLEFFRASDEKKFRISRRQLLYGGGAIIGWAS